jgi:ABC-type multidrug transport system ATPase subunit
LDDIRDALVGLPGVSGLSTEQRKRLTIAVELVSNPSVIFMDEPTSGLDARAAAIVMRAVKNVADTGRTVVCTIHQPSIEIFEAFDELMLMKRGGELIYAGPLGLHSCNVIHYFETIPGVPKIKDNYNPSTWMLEVTCASMEAQLGVDFAQIYRESTMCK